MKILIIEDDTELAQTMKSYLETSYYVDIAYNGEEGIYMAKEFNYSLVTIDIGLPDICGMEVCKLIRTANENIPVIMITGLTDETAVVKSLELGADAYLVKPFTFNEMHARIKALLRRPTAIEVNNKLNLGVISIDIRSREVRRNKELINLRKKEYDLLEFFVRNKGIVFSRQQLMEQAWKDDISIESNVVDVHIRALRKAIDAKYNTKYIKTVHGVGYKIDD